MDTLIIENIESPAEYFQQQESTDILSQWLGALENKSSLYWYQYSDNEEFEKPCKSIAHRDSELIAAITENCNHGPICYFCR